MLRLNTRHELPQIAMRQTQGRLDQSGIVQPRPQSGGNRQARSNQTVTQPGLSLDAYPSRKAYGHRTMRDYTAELGQRGIADVQAATGRHAQANWNQATNGARRGNYVTQTIKSEVFSDYQARTVFTISGVPDVQMQGYPNQVVGEPEQSDIAVDIQTTPNAKLHYTPGSVQTYLQNEGFIRHWVSNDHYDIYA